ncbi:MULTISPECIES: ribosome hibernation-promoting factor, HPF/YfiA family [Caproicibacterium]|uniref:Ribosome hibernation promoting factor n=1 Tax=Caproicibacterium argilliputei TaxID=3030016 RepID=A0AA97H2T5_9FIRM|nr:ribosome-associated translation inhibitor RaiA [Caproicibacterium argilliputei]WOC31518.1 ribosome-associated translation inhibitor RaiA [Caproicibacterium argilliputei]
MKVTITGRKVNLRENFKELARKKLSRFDRIFNENASAKVVVTVERNRQTVEITIVSDGMIFRGEAADPEMNNALDQVISVLGRQIRKNKAKLDKQIHSTALDQYVQQYVNATEEPEEEYKVVRTKHFIVKPMSVNEAILQMNLLEHQFFMFRNEETEEINVVYRRRQGNYGLLEPEEND